MRKSYASKIIMFCGKCGMLIEDDSLFCGNCGATVADNNTTENTVEQQAANTVVTASVATAAIDASTTDTATVSEPVFENTAPNPINYQAPTSYQAPMAPFGAAPTSPAPVNVPMKIKKPFNLRKFLFITIPALVVVLAIVLNLGAIVGFCVKTFGSPESYLAYVEANAFKENTEIISNTYGNIFTQRSTDIAYDGEAKFTISDNAMDMINILANEADVDLSDFKEFGFKVSTNAKDQKSNMDIIFTLAGEDLFTANVIVDMTEKKLWIGLPDLQEEYLELNLEEIAESEGIDLDSVDFEETTEVFNELIDALPSEDTVNKLLNKYIKIALDCIDDVEKSSTTLTVGEISQKVTELTFEVDSELLIEMGIAILEEAQQDKDIEKIVENLESYVRDQSGADVELYEVFYDAVAMGLEELEDGLEYADNENFITLHDYVNNSHEIIGRKIVVDEEELFYAKVNKGNKFEYELNFLDGEALITGNGTEKGGKLTGNFEVEAEGQSYVEIEVEDFESDELKDGYLNGTFRIKPTNELLSLFMMDSDSAEFISSFADVAFEFKSTMSKSDAYLGFGLLSGDEALFNFEVTQKEKGSKKVKTPSDSVSITNEDDLLDWAASVDIDEKLKEKLTPIIELFEYFAATQNDYYYDDYDYYGDYDYSYDDEYDFDSESFVDTW